jgi:transketolase
MLITGDLGYRFLEPFAQKFPDNFLNIGVAEANLVTVAAGLAATGFRPFIYSIATFASMRAFEQIRTDVVLQKLNVKVVGIGAGLAYNKAGVTHHSMEDIALMRLLPGMDIVAPVDQNETEAATEILAQTDNPAYLRLEKNPEAAVHAQLPDFKLGSGYGISKKDIYVQKFASKPSDTKGKGNAMRGNNITILVTGTKAGLGMEIARILESKNRPVSVYAFPTVAPLDQKLLVNIFQTNRIVVTVEEHRISGGFGTAVGEYLLDTDFSKSVRLIRAGLKNEFTPVSAEYDALVKYHGLTAGQIAEKILSVII